METLSFLPIKQVRTPVTKLISTDSWLWDSYIFETCYSEVTRRTMCTYNVLLLCRTPVLWGVNHRTFWSGILREINRTRLHLIKIVLTLVFKSLKDSRQSTRSFNSLDSTITRDGLKIFQPVFTTNVDSRLHSYSSGYLETGIGLFRHGWGSSMTCMT